MVLKRVLCAACVEAYTAYGWRRFLFMPVWTEWTMSGRMGACMNCQHCPDFICSRSFSIVPLRSLVQLVYVWVVSTIIPRIANCESSKLTLKTLGTVTVSFVDSPLAEMTVTVGLDMVSCVGGCCC
jgi:hypothetical protein